MATTARKQIGLLTALRRLLGGAPKRSPEEREWLRKIALAPEDRALRLAYAGWLEARGDPLGEFIRVDQALETDGLTGERREAFDRRWSELWEAHTKEWLAPLKRLGLEPEIAGIFAPYLWFHGGVLDEVAINRAGILPERADDLFAAAPGLRKIEFGTTRWHRGNFIDYRPDIATIVALPHFVQIGALDLRNLRLGDADVRALANSPRLGRLRELDLGYNAIGTEGVRLVAGSTTLKGLADLGLRGCGVDADGARALAASPSVAGLTRLDLGSNVIGTDGIVALAGSPHLRKLRALAMDACLGPDARLISPAEGPDLPASGQNMVVVAADGDGVLRFRTFDARGALVVDTDERTLSNQADRRIARACQELILSLKHHVKDLWPPRVLSTAEKALVLNSVAPLFGEFRGERNAAGAIALAGSPIVGELTELNLGGNDFGPEGVTALARSPGLTKLTALKLSKVGAEASGARALADALNLAGLTVLDLEGNSIGHEGAAALAGSPHLTKLVELGLGSNEIGDDGARALAESANLAHLTKLSLARSGIGSTGAQALAACPRLAGLTELDLSENPIGPDGALALAESLHLTKLENLILREAEVGPEGADRLRSRFGSVVTVD